MNFAQNPVILPSSSVSSDLQIGHFGVILSHPRRFLPSKLAAEIIFFFNLTPLAPLNYHGPVHNEARREFALQAASGGEGFLALVAVQPSPLPVVVSEERKVLEV